jgi:hypothetical protein
VCVIGSKPLVSINDAYFYLGKASWIIMMHRNAYRLIQFHGSHFECWLVTAWSDYLTKSGLPWNPRVFAHKSVWFTDRYKSYASGGVYPFDADREVVRYLTGVRHMTRSETRHLFLRLIVFAIGLESPFDLCYWVRRPQLRERSAKCLMTWKSHWSQMDPSHHSGLLGQSQSIDL